MTVWLCPACHERLDRGEPIRVDMTADHDNRRCAACGTPRLRSVPDAVPGTPLVCACGHPIVVHWVDAGGCQKCECRGYERGPLPRAMWNRAVVIDPD